MDDREENKCYEDPAAKGDPPREGPPLKLTGPVSKSEVTSGKVGGDYSGQDSGLSSAEGSSKIYTSPDKRLKSSPFITSTPKKGNPFSGRPDDLEVFPSQVILDDPLLSSIDDPEWDQTDEEVNSLTCDDESDDTSSTRLYDTKIRRDLGASTSASCTLMSRFMIDGSTKQKFQRWNSFSGPLKPDVIQPEVLMAKRSLFDIPVSPKLKSRVRERLFTLVNSIDGYDGDVNIENLERKMFELTSLSKRSCGVSDKLPSQFSGTNEDRGFASNKKVSSERFSRTCTSSQDKDISERCTSVLSSVLQSQLKALQFHQEQVNKEKVNLTLQKIEDEADARVSLYKKKVYEMVKMVKEMEIKVEESEREKIQQAQLFKNKMKQQSDRYKESLSLLNLEYEKKERMAESAIASARLEAMKACDEKIYEIMKSSRERIAAIEGKRQDHIFRLNSTISSLQAERRDAKWHGIDKVLYNESHLITNITDKSQEKDKLTSEIEILKKRLALAGDADKKSEELKKLIFELEGKQRTLREEVDVWREKANALQGKIVDMEMCFKRQIEEISENEKIKQLTLQSEKERQEHQNNKNAIVTLEKEVISLGAQLRDTVSSLSREKGNLRQVQKKHAKELAEIKEENEQEMINYRLLLERERSIAVSQAMVHREDETMALLRGVENRYQGLLKTLQAHFKAQIEEYKKAVKILKLKVKRLEETIAS